MAEVDVEKVIKDLAKSYGDSNEDQGKMVNLMKGLAFSDDAEANKFMKALDKWTTEYANKNVKESKMKEAQLVGVKIHDLENEDEYEMYSSKDAKDSVDLSVYNSVLKHNDTITMGKIIGEPIYENIITIEEEVRIPGTKIILEKGDRIQVVTQE